MASTPLIEVWRSTLVQFPTLMKFSFAKLNTTHSRMNANTMP